MANTIRLKRRASGGAAGAPATLATTEPAYNEVDDVLYLGKGDNGSGVATSVLPVGGKGAFADLTSAQTIAGIKTFSASPVAPTPTAGDSTTKVATTAFVAGAVTGGSVADGDKGDVVVSGSGALWTIDQNAVSNAKQAQMATKTYKGRTTAATGNVEDVPVATLKTDLALVKADVGLGNADNTSDLSKPVSTAQQSALDLKAPLANPSLNLTKKLNGTLLATVMILTLTLCSNAQSGSASPRNDDAAMRSVLSQALDRLAYYKNLADKADDVIEAQKAEIKSAKAVIAADKTERAAMQTVINNAEKVIANQQAEKVVFEQQIVIYEKQVKSYERQLAKEKGKSSFYKKLTLFGAAAGFIAGILIAN
jgi:hypothetical protein